MSPKSQKLYKKLCRQLDDMVKTYRALLNIVRREKEILISTNLDELNKNNRTKEEFLLRSRNEEEARIKISRELAEAEGLDPEKTKLLDFAKHFQGEEGDKLRNLHSVLELLLKRVREHNSKNEVLVKSALENITGAMNSIRDTLSDKTTYEKKGQVNQQPTESGQLVSREV